MSRKPLPPVDFLRKILRYDPKTGFLYWKERTPDMWAKNTSNPEKTCLVWNRKNANKKAFTTVESGYYSGVVLGVGLRAHRVAWALEHGSWPDQGVQMDHINGDRQDNRIENLRLCSASENGWNRPAYANNKSGYKGVSWHKNKGVWQAHITVNNKQKHLGFFTCPKQAAQAYAEEAQKHHGKFLNLNLTW